MTQITTINLFYPLISLVLIIGIVTIGIVFAKCKDSSLFNNIFNRHIDEHINTTDKFSKAHTEIIAGLPIVYQQEFHSLEFNVKANKEKIIKLENKINELLEKISILENK